MIFARPVSFAHLEQKKILRVSVSPVENVMKHSVTYVRVQLMSK